MKASTRLRKATELNDRVTSYLNSVSVELNKALGVEGEYELFFQGGDGLCINGTDSSNYQIEISEIDALLKLDKDDLLKELEKRLI